MKTSRFSDAQVMAILKSAEDGIPVPYRMTGDAQPNEALRAWHKLGDTQSLA